MTTVTELRQKTPQEIAKLKPKDQVKALLEQNKALIAQALPRHINPDRLLRVAQTAATTTPALLECYVPSLIGAIVQASQMGLEPNTVLGQAYLVPFNRKVKDKTTGRETWRKDVQLIPGYKGLIDLARRSGQIVSIAAHAVRERDEFEFEYGLTEKLRHIPADGERGEITHFYAVAHMKDGGHAFEVMSRAQVDKIRDGSQGYQTAVKYKNENTPWIAHYEEMGRKTAIRRLAKFLPLSVELATAVALDDMAAAGKDQALDTAISGEYTVLHDDEGDDNSDHGVMSGDAEVQTPGNNVVDDTPITDSTGEVWDQSKHATGGDGKPVFNSDGTFRKRRGAAQSEPPKQDLRTQIEAATTPEALDLLREEVDALPDGQDKSTLKALCLTRFQAIQGDGFGME